MRAYVAATASFLFLSLVLPAPAGPFEDGRSAYERGDYAAALSSYREAADQGSPAAMLFIGYMYENGLGLNKDFGEALFWYRKSAEAGEGMAMFNIGVFYRDGRGVKADQKEAFRWFSRAAELGVPDAAYSMAQAYNDGRGVTPDYKLAADYMFTSLSAGYPFAAREMNTNARAWHPEFRRALQRRLRDAGFYSGAIDGSFGPATRRAIDALFEQSKSAAPPPATADVKRGWFGVRIREVPAELASRIGANGIKGVLVDGVAPNSPAEEAGIRPGDLIFSWDGKDVPVMRRFIEIVGTTPIGKSVEVKVLRDWQELTLSAEVGEVPQEGEEAQPAPAETETEVADVTPMIVAFPELNVFVDPNVESEQVGTLVKGDLAEVSKRFTDIDGVEWGYICAEKMCGWVATEFLAPASDTQGAAEEDGMEQAPPAEPLSPLPDEPASGPDAEEDDDPFGDPLFVPPPLDLPEE